MNQVFKKIFSNASWLVAEQVFRLGLGLVVNIVIARYLGPKLFGVWSYALSLSAFLATFIYLGLNSVLVREILHHPSEVDVLLGSTFILKALGGCVAYCTLLAIAFGVHDIGSLEFWVLLYVGVGLVLRPFEVIDFWFQSKTQSKYSVCAKSTAFCTASLFKLTLVYFGSSIVILSTSTLMESALAAFLLIVIYRQQGGRLRLWKFSLRKSFELLSKSWLLIASGFFALVYLKIDQIMLRWMIGQNEVGIYSVAVKFSEAWFFIPAVVAASVFPTLVEQKSKSEERYLKSIQKILDWLIIIAFCVALLMTFAGEPMIVTLYGKEYARAAPMLTIQVWAGLFVFMRAIFSKWLVIEDFLKFSLISHAFGAGANVVLNLSLIPHFAGTGAAIASLISYIVASYLVLFVSPSTRPFGIMMSKSLILPSCLLRLCRKKDSTLGAGHV
jgi:O-antigen/teichoic acid export membrane protein